MSTLRRPLAGLLPAVAAAALALSSPAFSAEGGAELPERHWSFQGLFGTFDRAAQQRGFQVYQEVCAACHSMSLLHYRDLAGIGFDGEQVKAIAAQSQITAGPDDAGEMFERPGIPADTFRNPFANPQAARAANNGALPPDLTLIVEARKGGADYIHAVMIGYADAPPDVAVPEGMHYNIYFPGHQIAMPPPLSEGAVTYADGTEATVEQMASDVVTFLTWAAEPNLEGRKRMGVKVILFLIVFTGMLYAVKRKIWLDVRH